MSNKVENTSKKDPAAILLEHMLGVTIEDTEKRGTEQLAESSVLPSEGLVGAKSNGRLYADWAEKCGIKLLGLVEGDDLFVHVELPAGWRQEKTDHDMHNNLLDEKGRRRAGIFYKAAFYDRRADIRPEKRFIATYGNDHDNFDDKRCWGLVKDCGKEVWRGEVLDPGPNPYNPQSKELCMQTEIAGKQARAWLEERYPDHEDFNAYWE